MRHSTAEVAGPALHLIGVRINPIKTRLRVFILPFYRSKIDAEKYVAIVGSPAQIILYRFVARYPLGWRLC